MNAPAFHTRQKNSRPHGRELIVHKD